MKWPGQDVMNADMDHVLVTTLATTVKLPAGSHGRGLPCLICAKPIGGRPADMVTMWPVKATGCSCGRIDVASFLFHAAHDMPDSGTLISLARDRLISEHDGGQVPL